ncbi:hypothetical protein ACFOGG_05655 [Brenneria rubrifaciens]
MPLSWRCRWDKSRRSLLSRRSPASEKSGSGDRAEKPIPWQNLNIIRRRP